MNEEMFAYMKNESLPMWLRKVYLFFDAPSKIADAYCEYLCVYPTPIEWLYGYFAFMFSMIIGRTYQKEQILDRGEEN